MIQDSPPAVAFREAVERIGSQRKAARVMGVSQQAVSGLLKRGSILPAEYVSAVEMASGIPRHYLRPDIFPVEQAPAPGIRPGRAPAAEHDALTAGALNPLEGLQR